MLIKIKWGSTADYLGLLHPALGTSLQVTPQRTFSGVTKPNKNINQRNNLIRLLSKINTNITSNNYYNIVNKIGNMDENYDICVTCRSKLDIKSQDYSTFSKP